MTLEITEKQFSSPVEDLLNRFGWHWCHFRPARTEKGWRTALSGHQGLPDYIAVRPPRLLIFELKSERGKVSPKQQEWLDILKQCTPILDMIPIPEVYLFRPSQLEEIVGILR